jgi:PhnB protein
MTTISGGTMRLNPYLNFNGRCAEAFKFYKQCLGGTILTMQKFGETPMAKEVPPEWHEKIIHVSLQIDNEIVLMGSDAVPQYYAEPNGFSVAIHTKDPEKLNTSSSSYQKMEK